MTAGLAGCWIGLRPLQSSSPTARGLTVPGCATAFAATARLRLTAAGCVVAAVAKPCTPSERTAPIVRTTNAENRRYLRAVRNAFSSSRPSHEHSHRDRRDG